MSIEKGLNALPGVEATVHFATESARVAFDSTSADVATFISTIEGLGSGARTLAAATPDMLDAEVREQHDCWCRWY